MSTNPVDPLTAQELADARERLLADSSLERATVAAAFIDEVDRIGFRPLVDALVATGPPRRLFSRSDAEKILQTFDTSPSDPIDSQITALLIALSTEYLDRELGIEATNRRSGEVVVGTHLSWAPVLCPAAELLPEIARRVGTDFVEQYINMRRSESGPITVPPSLADQIGRTLISELVGTMAVWNALEESTHASAQPVVAPLRRAESFDTQNAREATRQAAEVLIQFLQPFHDTIGESDPDNWILLDVSLRTLNAQIHHPQGNPTILASAMADAVRAVSEHVSYPDHPLSTPARSIIETAPELGAEDPDEAGDAATRVLETAFDAANSELDKEPSYIYEAVERLRSGSLAGLEQLARDTIVNLPAGAANLAAIIALWADLPGMSAPALAWLILRVVLGTFKRRG